MVSDKLHIICGNCKYPNCFDKVSKYGKNCMELKQAKYKNKVKR